MSKTTEIAEQYQQHVMATYFPPSLALVKGKGTRVWDGEGKVYLDFVAGIAAQNVGHCHPKVVEAVQKQAAQLVHVSNLFYNENQPKLAAKLAGLALNGKCFFCNSGAEANETLIKLARLWGHDRKKYEIISMTNSFHGRTLAALAATGQTKYQAGFEPMPAGFVYAAFNELEAVRAQITEQTVAVLVEAVQGEGGVIAATPEFLRGLRALCDERQLLLLCDEVQCGLGRTGHWFGFQAAAIKPDAFSLAKALGSGYPIGAAVAGPQLADVFQPGKHATTFGGSPLACAAALATLQVIEEEDLPAKAAATGKTFLQRLQHLKRKYEHIKEARGCGLMVGLELDQPAKPFVDALRDKGLLALKTGDQVVRFLPPLNVKTAELDEALEILDEALAEMHGMRQENEAEGSNS